LRFNTLKGFTGVFKDLNGDYKKKLPDPPAPPAPAPTPAEDKK